MVHSCEGAETFRLAAWLLDVATSSHFDSAAGLLALARLLAAAARLVRARSGALDFCEVFASS
jgi:hypothetical protein